MIVPAEYIAVSTDMMVSSPSLRPSSISELATASRSPQKMASFRPESQGRGEWVSATMVEGSAARVLLLASTGSAGLDAPIDVELRLRLVGDGFGW